MKKNYKKMICLFLGVIILTMAQPVFCSAWGPPKTEDEEKFLEWYEKHKNDQNAVYTLTGDLKLTKGTKEDPIRFDGRGKVRIDCGNHGIIVNSRVIIDNPELTISGNYMFVLMENSIDSHLILKRGTVLDESDDACAVQVIRGTLQTSSDPSDRFTIQMKGKDITGIYHGTDEPLVLRQINVTAKGKGRVEGVKNNRNQTLSLTDCNIKVSGDQEACGVSNLGRTEVNRCRITASVSDASGTAVSVAGSEISSRDSKIVPEITGMKNTVYSIYDVDSFTPVIGRTGTDLKSLLPQNASVYVENAETEEKSIISMPVIWDASGADTSKEGITLVKGRLLTKALFGIYINSSGFSPETAVIAVPPEGMFLNSYRILSKEEGRIRGMLELPYPAGADSMILQYSADQKNWRTYEEKNGSTNIIRGQDFPKPFGVFSFVFDIPVNTKTFYMRTKVHGSSIFSGTSAVWKIDVDHGAPESSVSGESGGDRGGQTVEQEESTQKDQRSEGKPGYSEKSVRYKDKNSFSDQKSEKSQNVKKNGSSQRQEKKKEKVQGKKTAPEVQDNEKQTPKTSGWGRNAKSYDKGDLVFAAIGILLIFGAALLLGRKFFRKKNLS